MIPDSLNSVTQRMDRALNASGRRPGSVKLVCVTKEASLEDIRTVLKLGVKVLGENRVQDALIKYNEIGPGAEWHLIGHLQTNKVRDAVRIAALIHSLDSFRLAEEIEKHASRLNKVQDVLVQVNISGEESKFGVAPGDTAGLIKAVSAMKHVRIKGLMTMAPESGLDSVVRPCFRGLARLRDELNVGLLKDDPIHELSMGMTNDFEIAIEEGSTMVRIGRAIFK